MRRTSRSRCRSLPRPATKHRAQWNRAKSRTQSLRISARYKCVDRDIAALLIFRCSSLMPLRKISSTSSRNATLGSILLVDDNKLGLCARKSVLEELGHRISTASNGVDALEQFVAGKFDLVVTDFKMPRMNGLDLIVGLRKIAPNLPVILISGFVDALGLNEET